EVVPEKSVQRLHRRAELKVRETAIDLARHAQQPVQDGMIVRVEFLRLKARKDHVEAGVVARRPAHLTETAGVPELVAEVLSALDPVLLEADILALRRDRDDPETQAIGAVRRDEIERVGRVAERFRHLASLRIADDAGEVNVTERNPPIERLAGPDELEARHDHARDPEEDDVGTGDE